MEREIILVIVAAVLFACSLLVLYRAKKVRAAVDDMMQLRDAVKTIMETSPSVNIARSLDKEIAKKEYLIDLISGWFFFKEFVNPLERKQELIARMKIFAAADDEDMQAMAEVLSELLASSGVERIKIE